MVEINYKCVCSKMIYNHTKNKLCVLIPCRHILHQICYCILKKKYNLSKCPYCAHSIYGLITENTINNNTSTIPYSNIFTDINTLTYNNKLYIDLHHLFIRIPFILFYITQIFVYFIDHKKYINNICKTILAILNIKINIINKNKDINIQKIYISNHTYVYDMLILMSAIDKSCGFLASNHCAYGKYITEKIIPLFFTKFNGQTCFEAEKYFKNIDRICIYPEGLFTNEHTIAKFRSCAFYFNRPIQPIIIKYNNMPQIYYDNPQRIFLNIFARMGSSLHTVDIIFMEPIYPPFKSIPHIIEHTRHSMAKQGNFTLSNMSSKMN